MRYDKADRIEVNKERLKTEMQQGLEDKIISSNWIKPGLI